MSYLTEKMAPHSLDEVVGNEPAVSKANYWLSAKDKHPTLLIHGPLGCCKTTIGEIIAKALGSPPRSPDCHQVPVSRYTVDNFRDITDNMGLGLFGQKQGAWEVYLFDEAHHIPAQAQAMLLAKAAKPPKQTVLIFITSEPQKLDPALRSRCQEFEVTTLTRSETVQLLERACKAEGVAVPEEVLKTIAKEVHGNPRNALIRLNEELNRREAADA